MHLSHAALVAALAAIVTFACPAGARAAGDDATVMLYLEGGVEKPAPNTWETKDMELELAIENGQWQKEAWGYAVWFNRADHEGEVTKATGTPDAAKLEVRLTVYPDRWYPKGKGEARYAIDLKRDGDAYTGTYTGTFSYPNPDGGTVTNEVSGKVTGGLYPRYTKPVEGFKPLAANEHPRLIFRKSDLPEIRRRMGTPEGQAIMKRFMAQLDKFLGGSTSNKCVPMFPAGYGVAYQLTGDKKYADEAQKILTERVLDPDIRGSQDIHFGPIALGTAITYDMCYDAWDEAYRTRVATWLAKRTYDLASGRNIGTYSPNPWHNHNGVRAPSCGLAAIALLGEKGEDGKPFEGLDRIIRIIARDTRRYFWYGGIGETGWCLEGAFYKRMTWNSGPGHFIQAWRTAYGGKLIDGWPGAYAILGEWMEAPPSDRTPHFSIGDHQSSGLWPVGLVTVPDAWKPAARKLYDDAYGLSGDGTFGIAWAYQAAYVLMNYPFDTPAAKDPGDVMPWVGEDPRQGHWLLRRPWAGGDDFLLINHLRSKIMTGCHYERSGRTGDMQLFALGRQWIGDRRMTEDTGAGCALIDPGLYGKIIGNEIHGIWTTYYKDLGGGRMIHSMDCSPAFLEALPKGKQPGPDQKPAIFVRGGTHVDHGVRAHRYLAVDTSGASGAPVMIAWIDRVEGGKNPTWRLGLAKDAGETKIDGNTVTVGDPAGKHMRLTFVGGDGLSIKPGLSATGADEYFVILTIQDGAAPAVKVEGKGLGAKVTVGGQTVTFDGEKLNLAK